MKNPKITVLMPVYNGEKYLREAIDSILTQTFDDFEFIILDDDSKDKGLDIIKSYADKRIQLIMHEGKKGIAGLLNEGIRMARGEYIARMDCDDISLPLRLEKQIDYMELNPQIGICGTWAQILGRGNGDKSIKHPIDHQHIIVNMLFGNISFIHPSVMFRKKIFLENKLFYDDIIAVEDYDLWERARKFTQFANIPQCLIKYRWSTKSDAYLEKDNFGSENIQKKLIGELIDNISEEEWKMHCAIVNLNHDKSKEFLSAVNNWFDKLLSSNRNNRKFNQNVLANALAFRWILICKKYPLMKLIKLKSFMPIHLKYIRTLSFLQKRIIINMVLIKILNCFKFGKSLNSN